MPEQIKTIVHQFIRERFTLSRISDILKNTQKSHLFEIVGNPGSGKSYLIEPIIETLQDNIDCIVRYSPHPFWDNHLKEILLKITNLSEQDIIDLCKTENQPNNSGHKFDFFYYLSEKLTQREALKPCLLIIDDCDLLDAYSRDFLQYIVQYAEEVGLQIISLSHTKLFPFSEVDYMLPLSKINIEQLIHKTFPGSDLTYTKESEIFKNISEGNLLIIETILTDMVKSKAKKFNISDYIDKHYNTEEIYLHTLNSMSDAQKTIMLNIFVLDGASDSEDIKKLVGIKSLQAELSRLEDMNLIYQLNDTWLVRKKITFSTWMLNDNPDLTNSVIEKALVYLSKKSCCIQLRAKLSRQIKQYDADLCEAALKELSAIADNEACLSTYQFILPFQTNSNLQLEITKKIGLTYSDLNQKDKAVEYFRQCLQICTANDLPAEEIIYFLANNLYAINSSSFALEIIKKYSPATINPVWKSKILLKKAEILTESEQFNEAKDVLEEVARSMTNLDDKKVRYSLQGEAKKVMGRIHYYINEYEQAEVAFREAETMYTMSGDQQGLAAIYNNIGVLHMFQGEWEKSEQFFLRSLNLEKEYYNLNGL
jgi:tetratricopeptide (TPR) repeat protein